MNYLDNKTLNAANDEGIFNVYAYLSDKVKDVREGTRFIDIVKEIEKDLENSGSWEAEEINQLSILRNAVDSNEALASATIGNQINKPGGLSACTFTRADGGISVVFRGSGAGEWIDNGEGLSGIPEENTYNTYKNGELVDSVTVAEDYATDQQVEALNWFNQIASENGWDESTNITISGHSKGGNKAQFITVCSDLVDDCYSFDGQGFSPEALDMFEEKYGIKYEERRQKILSFAA